MRSLTSKDTYSSSEDHPSPPSPSSSSSSSACPCLFSTRNDKHHDENCNRRKKVTRACGNCQKAHLTCENERPCSRCARRGLADSCVDGVRKQAKYLREDDSEMSATCATVLQPSVYGTTAGIQKREDATEARLTVNTFSLGGNTARYVDACLPDVSNIVTSANMGAHVDVAGQQGIKRDYEEEGISNTSPLPTRPFNPTGQFDSIQGTSADPSSLFNYYGFGSEAVNLEYSILSNMFSGPADAPKFAPHMGLPDVKLSDEGWSNLNTDLTGADFSTLTDTSPPTLPQAPHDVAARRRRQSTFSQESVYSSVTKPYPYSEGFHYLLKYVKERMGREDVMKICRAMAQIRPSFIALIMNLTEEDLIFIEQCFQRTILEFEKLISFSGTPTVVWRRTAEIALVGKEFSLLTQWTNEQLLGKRTYIYELMDDRSAVEYWEKFSVHAFDNSQQSVMTNCVLVTPSGKKVNSAFCFTIKRDIFDIPLAIVGNFLPILI